LTTKFTRCTCADRCSSFAIRGLGAVKTQSHRVNSWRQPAHRTTAVLSSQFSVPRKTSENRWLIADGYFAHQQAIMALIKFTSPCNLPNLFSCQSSSSEKRRSLFVVGSSQTAYATLFPLTRLSGFGFCERRKANR